MKYLKALAVLALAVAFAVPAYAETQNVKVSGSLDTFAFARDNYDLAKGDAAGTTSSQEQYLMSQTQVEVAADLTDNVSTVINLANERDWDVPGASNMDVLLDLAYVQMKEIFYSPLTLTVGRQDIWLGRGFVIGNNNRSWDPQATIGANEYSVMTAFDAIRATLDFSPWTIDVIYAKIAEGNLFNDTDTDLYVANINYKFAEYNAVAEGYYVGNIDKTNRIINGTDDTHTIGGRVQFDPISQITLGGELAYQFGNYATGPEQDRSAWGLDVFGTYRWDMTWKPELTLEYVRFSGEEVTPGTGGEYGAWNSLYRGKFWTAYADFRESFGYTTTQAGDQTATSNENLLQVKGALKPLEDLLLEGSFTYLWAAEDYSVSGSNDIGWEVDLQATYDYTEDVSFGLLTAWFVPGDAFSNPNDQTAQDIVGSVKVTF